MKSKLIKLTEIVQGMIAGGHTFGLDKPSLLQISQEHVVFIEYSYQKLGCKEPCEGRAYKTFTVADLLADAGAMVVFGERLECRNYKCTPFYDKGFDGNCTVKSDITDCTREMCSLEWRYHSIEAFKLIQDGNTDAAIEYLHANLLKNTDE